MSKAQTPLNFLTLRILGVEYVDTVLRRVLLTPPSATVSAGCLNTAVRGGMSASSAPERGMAMDASVAMSSAQAKTGRAQRGSV